eukprot:4460792-Pyramimonas_sp.AAC.1
MMRHMKCPSLRETLNCKLYNATDRPAFPLPISLLGTLGEEVVERLLIGRKMTPPLGFRSVIANKPQTRRDGMA